MEAHASELRNIEAGSRQTKENKLADLKSRNEDFNGAMAMIRKIPKAKSRLEVDGQKKTAWFSAGALQSVSVADAVRSWK